jgi:TPR repeat protein
MYALGKGVARSDKNAVQWWQKAADNEHALALLILGVLFAAKQASTNFHQEQGIFSMESSAQDPIPMAWW